MYSRIKLAMQLGRGRTFSLLAAFHSDGFVLDACEMIPDRGVDAEHMQLSNGFETGSVLWQIHSRLTNHGKTLQ